MPLLGIYNQKITESRISKRHLHTHVYSSILYNCQKVGATQQINGEMHMVQINGGILCSLENEEHSDTHCNMADPGGYGK